MKIPKKYSGVLFPLIMAFIMSALISLVMVIKNIGFEKQVFSVWIISWPIAFIVAFPIAVFVAPLSKKLVEKITY